MRRRILSDNFDAATVRGHWTKDLNTAGGLDYAIAITLSKLEFTHGADTTMASAFVAYAVRMPSPNYSVSVTAKVAAGDTGVILIGIRGVAADGAGASRVGYYVAVSVGETGTPEGSSDSWTDNKVRIYNIPSDSKWDTADALTLSATEGLRDPSNVKQADFTTAANTDFVIRMRVIGPRIEVWINGSLIAVATDTDLTLPGFIRLGVQSDENGAVVTFDDLNLIEENVAGGSGKFVGLGYDEARRDLYVNVPVTAQEQPSRQFVYDVEHDEWYQRDRVMRSLGRALDDRGEQRLIFGDDQGRINVLDDSNTWTDDSATFTGTWQSNWLDMGSKAQRTLFERLVVGVAKATVATAAVVTLEVADHPDGKTYTRSGTVHMQRLRTSFMTRLGGRYVRIKVVHSAAGDLEIERILVEAAGSRPGLVEAR